MIAVLLQHGAEIAQRLVVVWLHGESAPEIGDRLVGIVLHHMHEAALVPALAMLWRKLGHGIEHLEREIEIGLQHESVDPQHQEIDGVAAG